MKFCCHLLLLHCLCLEPQCTNTFLMKKCSFVNENIFVGKYNVYDLCLMHIYSGWYWEQQNSISWVKGYEHIYSTNWQITNCRSSSETKSLLLKSSELREYMYVCINLCSYRLAGLIWPQCDTAAVGQLVVLASFARDTRKGSIPGVDRPKSLKQAVTSPMPNARQLV